MQHWHKIIDTLILNLKFQIHKQRSIILTGLMEEGMKGRMSSSSVTTSSTEFLREEGDEGGAESKADVLFLFYG